MATPPDPEDTAIIMYTSGSTGNLDLRNEKCLHLKFFLSFLLLTECLRRYRKYILQLRTYVLGRLRDLQYIFAVTYETFCKK